MYWDILQHVYGLVFAFSRSSEMSIMLIFGRFDGSVLQFTTDEDCMFYSTGFYQCRCNKLQGCP